MKAFSITLDALIAVSFFLLAILLIYSQTFVSVAPRGTYLKQVTLDILTVSSSSDYLALALSGNNTPLHELLETTSDSICLQIAANKSTSPTWVTIFSKNGCGSYGSQLQSASMPFFYNETPYLVTAQSWYKR